MKEKGWLIQREKKIRIFCSEAEDSAVRRAVFSLAGDVKKTCGSAAELFGEWRGEISPDIPTVVVATAGTPWYERQINEENQIELNRLKDEKGRFRWEGFLQQVSGGILFLIGADRRGTVFAVYDLCEMLGVSPWYFWGDVPVRQQESFSLPADYRKSDWPDVPYRGIFLNDEEELEAYAKKHTGDGTIGPETYQRIFELILRLKGNYIWPAMHVNYFNENPENGRLAQEMGVVVGTSHCDMLLRSNQNEWQPWLEKKGYTDVRYDYSISGQNRERIREYWKESVEMNRNYEVTYTVGMRGIHDSGFITREIDKAPSLSKEEKTERKIRLLEQVIGDQRELLRDVLGEEHAACAVQTFIPYKEVLDLYDQGLKIPEDITLIWVDDNFGYMRRYPDELERVRKGGNGLYYHASYWAAPGMSYLFFNSIPLAQTGNELKKCWESGIRKIWVLNVGALKPLEMDMEFFLRYAWSAGREAGEIKDTERFVANWIDRNFSGGWGKQAAEINSRFAQLNNVCKPEHLRSFRFLQTAYGNEAERRLEELKRLAEEGNAICNRLPDQERDAFLELFLMKIQASWYINASFYYADRSCLSWDRGAMQAADSFLDAARKMDRRKKELLYYYNEVMQAGKWSGILTPESFPPPPTALYPAARPALVLNNPELGAVWEKLTFHAHGRERKRVTLFNRGSGAAEFRIEIPDWIEADAMEGMVEGEKVITLHARREQNIFQEERKGMLVIRGKNGEQYEAEVTVLKEADYSPAGNCAFYAEADGYISILAGGYTAGNVQQEEIESVSPESEAGQRQAPWRRIRHLGRGWGDAMEVHIQETEDSVSGNQDMEEGKALEYAFFLERKGAFLLEIHRFLTLNPKGRIRLAVAVDGEKPAVLESATVDEWKGNWKNAVLEDGEKLYTMLPWLEAGLHRLQIYPVDRYVTLSRLVIYTEKRQENDLGPADSAFFDGTVWRKGVEEREAAPAPSAQEETFWKEACGDLPDEFLRLPMLYAGPDFWKMNRLYVRSEGRADIPGKKKYAFAQGEPKNLFQIFGSGLFEGEGGKVAIEAEYALEDSRNAWLTPSVPDGNRRWRHTQAETDGETGLAMICDWGTDTADRQKVDPHHAAGMHYRFRINEAGNYILWLLMKFEDTDSDFCRIGMDGRMWALSQMYASGDGFFTYSMKQRWHWRAVGGAKLTQGIHLLSIYGTKPGLRIDRIYLSKGSEWPPVDIEWKESRRTDV